MSFFAAVRWLTLCSLLAVSTATAKEPVLWLLEGGNAKLAKSVRQTLAPTLAAPRAVVRKINADRALRRMTGDAGLYAKLSRLRTQPDQRVIFVLIFRRDGEWWLDAALLDGVDLNHLLLPASGPAGTDWHVQLRQLVKLARAVAPPGSGTATPTKPMVAEGEPEPMEPQTPPPVAQAQASPSTPSDGTAPTPSDPPPPAEHPDATPPPFFGDMTTPPPVSDPVPPTVAAAPPAELQPDAEADADTDANADAENDDSTANAENGEGMLNPNGDAVPKVKPARPYNPNARARFFDAQVGPGLGARFLSYRGLTSQNLSSYRLPAAPLVLLGAQFAPLARSKFKVLRDSYLYATLSESIAVRSYDSFIGNSFDTRWSAWEAGVAIRSRTSDWGPVLGARLGYGNETFAVEEGKQLVTQQPSVSYSYLALAFVLDQPISRVVRFEAALGYRLVFDPGYLGDRFAHTRVTGFNASVAFRILLAKGFTLRILAQYAGYLDRITSAATDPYVATGATDQYVTAGIQATWGL